MLNICQFRYAVHLFPLLSQGSRWALYSQHQLILLFFDFWLGLVNGKQKHEIGRQKQRETGALTSQAPARLGLGAAEFSTEAPVGRPFLMAAALQTLVTMLPSSSSGLWGLAPGSFAIPLGVPGPELTLAEHPFINSSWCISWLVLWKDWCSGRTASCQNPTDTIWNVYRCSNTAECWLLYSH